MFSVSREITNRILCSELSRIIDRSKRVELENKIHRVSGKDESEGGGRFSNGDLSCYDVSTLSLHLRVRELRVLFSCLKLQPTYDIRNSTRQSGNEGARCMHESASYEYNVFTRRLHRNEFLVDNTRLW